MMRPVRSIARSHSSLVICALLLVGCEASPIPLGPQRPFSPAGVALVLRTELGEFFGFNRLSTDGARIYTANDDGGIVAVDMTTGKVAWRLTTPDTLPMSEASYDAGRVYAATTTARAWSATSGTLLWETPLVSTRSARGHIGHAAGGMYFIGTDSTLFALNGATGAVQWRVSLGDGWAFSGRIRSVAGAGDALYVCTGEPLDINGANQRGHIVAVDRATGAIRWRYIMEFESNRNFCMGEPTIAGDVVVVGDAGGNNYVAVDRATGALRWRVSGDPYWVGPYASPEASGEVLYGASNDKLITAINRSTGAVLWRRDIEGSAWHVIRCGSVLLSHAFGVTVLHPGTGNVLAENITGAYGRDDMVSSRILVLGNNAYAVGNGRFYKWSCPK